MATGMDNQGHGRPSKLRVHNLNAHGDNGKINPASFMLRPILCSPSEECVRSIRHQSERCTRLSGKGSYKLLHLI